jgi:hypothetical protein
VVPFTACETKESFFENGVVAVPESQSEADGLMTVADAADTILPPAIGF